MEIVEIQEDERRKKRTTGERVQIVLRMFVRSTSDGTLFWQTPRRQWLRKPSSCYILLHRPYKKEEKKQNIENLEEASNLSSMRNSCVLPVIPWASVSFVESVES